MDDLQTTTPARSVIGALLTTVFLMLLLVALMDPTGTTAVAGIAAAAPSHSRQVSCPGDSVAGSATRADAVSCTR